MALASNESMLRLFLERILLASPHGEPVNLELPEDITKRELLLTMGEKVLRAIANQDITPTQGKVILGLVEEQKRLVSMQEHDFEMRKILGRT